MRKLIVALLLSLGTLTAALPSEAYVGVNIGINIPTYPRLVAVPGYPVYYAPGLDANYFFYDGLYWVYDGDSWYESNWYNGPWTLVDPIAVPAFILRVPVRYYRHPPGFFHGWRADLAPRWHEHWGANWAERRADWNRWDRRSVPAAAPLPHYQRQYSGNRYPQAERQATIQSQHYAYQPRDAMVQQHYAQHVRPEAQHSRPEAARAHEGGHPRGQER